MPESVLSLGREVGAGVSPLEVEEFVPEGARPTHNLADFVTHRLNMYSYPRQISDVVSKKIIIGPFISRGLVPLTQGPQIMKSSPLQQNILW